MKFVNINDYDSLTKAQKNIEAKLKDNHYIEDDLTTKDFLFTFINTPYCFVHMTDDGKKFYTNFGIHKVYDDYYCFINASNDDEITAFKNEFARVDYDINKLRDMPNNYAAIYSLVCGSKMFIMDNNFYIV